VREERQVHDKVRKEQVEVVDMDADAKHRKH
jgi:hypothetical protein